MNPTLSDFSLVPSFSSPSSPFSPFDYRDRAFKEKTSQKSAKRASEVAEFIAALRPIVVPDDNIMSQDPEIVNCSKTLFNQEDELEHAMGRLSTTPKSTGKRTYSALSGRTTASPEFTRPLTPLPAMKPARFTASMMTESTTGKRPFQSEEYNKRGLPCPPSKKSTTLHKNDPMNTYK